MNIKRLTLLAASCLMVVSGVLYIKDPVKEKYFPRENTFFKQQQELASGYIEYMKSIRANPNTGDISYQDVYNAHKVADKLPKGSKTLDLKWRFKGPDNVGGRTRAIVVDRNDTAHIITGGVSGGIWESFDAGKSWEAYDAEFKIQNVSAMAQASDGSIYVGTGSTFDGDQDQKANQSHFLGNGLFKLTGNGTADTILSPAIQNTFNTAWTAINRIAVDPSNSKRLFVAERAGLFEVTIDGNGPGDHIVRTIRANTCYDVEFVDQKVVGSFSGGQLEVSTDNGNTFSRIDLTTAGAGRMEIAIAPSNSNIQYASIATSTFGGCLLGVFRTTDSWQTFDRLPTPNRDYFDTGLPNRCQGGYDQEIIVFPDNPNKILLAGVVIGLWNQSSVDPAPIEGEWLSYASNFGGGIGNENPSYVHSDVHEFIFNPNNSKTLYIGSDGGVAVTFNSDQNRPSFSQANLGFNVTQFYDISVGPNDLAMGGTQDNGSQLIGLDFNTGNSSVQVFGGDGFDQEMFTINPSLGIASIYYGNPSRIQGIGTNLANSTLNSANLLTGNLLNLCGGEGAGLFRCSEVFYTVTSIWESFDHKETKDSVLLVFEQKELGPIPTGTVLYTESKNSSASAYGNFQDLDFDLYEVDRSRLLTYDTLKADLFPVDTVNGFFQTETKNVKAVITRMAIGHDSVIINPVARIIHFKYAQGGQELVRFEYGETIKWDNIFAEKDENAEQLSMRVDSLPRAAGTQQFFKLTYREYLFDFRYEIEIPDLIQSTVAVCNIRSPLSFNSRDVWISKDILKGADVNEPLWVLAANRDSKPSGLPDNTDFITAEFSADGNHLFLGTSNSLLYRVDNINNIDVSQIDNLTPRDFVVNDITEVHLIEDFKRNPRVGGLGIFAAITGIAIDPNDANNIVVTLGNYGVQDDHVFRSSNALLPDGDDEFTNLVTFERIANGLPRTPVYDAIIDRNDPNIVLIATELGVFATENARATNPADVVWTEENNGMGKVPAVAIDQMTFGWDEGAINEGKVYVGTHGRGIFESDNLVSTKEQALENGVDEDKASFELKLYPNPVSEIVTVEAILDANQNSLFRVYSISGQLVKEVPIVNFSNGLNNVQLDLGDLERGAYVLQLINGDQSKTSRLIKQ